MSDEIGDEDVKVHILAAEKEDNGHLSSISENLPSVDEYNDLPEYQPQRFKPRNLYFEDDTRRIDYILAYSTKGKSMSEEGENARKIFQENLVVEGLQLENHTKEEDVHYIKVHAPFEVLSRYAEILKIRMPMKEWSSPERESAPISRTDPGVWDSFKGIFKKITKPFELDPNKVPPMIKQFNCCYSRDKEYLFEMPNRQGDFFNNAMRSRIVDYILRRKSFSQDKHNCFAFGIKKMIADDYFVAAYPLHEGHWKPGSADNCRKVLYDHWARWKNVIKVQPLDMIRDYYGERIGLYFTWLGFYTWMLVPASIMGFIVFLYGLATMNTNISSMELCDGANFTMCPLCDVRCPYWNLKEGCLHKKVSWLFDNGATVFFALFMSMWGTMFLEFWKRKEAVTRYRWNLLNFESEEEPPRPEYLARLADAKTFKLNPVTRLQEPHISFWGRRVPIFCFSISLMVFLAMVAIVAVIGVIAFRISITAALQLRQEEVIYKNASLVTSVTAAIINLIIIIILNMLYSRIAFWLTDLECLRTQSEYDNSITLKLFLLQFVNYYSSIIYIAFFKGRFVGRPGKYNTFFGARQEECDAGGCLIELCIQLSIIMVGKQLIQQNLVEILIPKVMKCLRLALRRQTKDIRKGKTPWEKDYNLATADNTSLFYEYLEMVLQFGFLTIFVAAFPLGPLFALLNNVIEIRCDANKFVTQLRRPMAQRSADIGIWYDVLLGISRIAVISNAFIIAVTSDFIPRLVYRYAYSPDGTLAGYVENSLAYFNTSDIGTHLPVQLPVDNTTVDVCRYRAYRYPPWSPDKYELSPQFWHVMAARLAFVVIFENVVVVASSFIAWLIPDVPAKLKEQIRREAYVTNEVILKIELLRARGEVIKDETMKKISESVGKRYEDRGLRQREPKATTIV